MSAPDECDCGSTSFTKEDRDEDEDDKYVCDECGTPYIRWA